MVLNKFNFSKVLDALRRQQVDIPLKIANNSRKYFTGNFKKQSFDGKNWKEVQRRIPGTSEYKYPSKPKASSRTSPILVRTGKLRREVNNSIRSYNWNEIKLGVSDAVPYAVHHNEGTTNIPQRKIMGNSKELQKSNKEKIRIELLKIFK